MRCVLALGGILLAATIAGCGGGGGGGDGSAPAAPVAPTESSAAPAPAPPSAPDPGAGVPYVSGDDEAAAERVRATGATLGLGSADSVLERAAERDAAD